jgi:Alternative oxidase
MYHTFNFITGYKHIDPTVQSIEWRLIILESVAGVPGFIGAGFRHFHSLRALERDHGWITTLLEEAENERMHLLVCLKMFNASLVTRLMVITAQCILAPFLMGLYAVHPSSVHRFVGYLEETACHTYASVIEHLDKPGTNLHNGWNNLPAPKVAISYWRLPEDAMWRDALLCMVSNCRESRETPVYYSYILVRR